ncbi:hypothetical protein V7S43_014628 [Phytophthora oleae]
MAALQDAQASNVLERVESLQKLCLKAIGRHLQHFCNLRLHPALAEALSVQEKQLLFAYDLSRLDVFEPQVYLQTIDKWCAKMERRQLQRRGHFAPKRVDRAMKSFLRYVLQPSTRTQHDHPFRELEVVLGLIAAPKLKLRSSRKPRRKWISDTEENQSKDEDSAPLRVDTPQPFSQHETVCFRLPAASVGCGVIADILQHSDSIVKLRLNNCQVANAGAILLASGIRHTKMLELLDISNDDSVNRSADSMNNEIGDEGVRAIALALEQNTSVKEVDLSRNPIGSSGAVALALMLRKNVHLQRLFLDHTFIQDSAETLIDEFQASKS